MVRYFVISLFIFPIFLVAQEPLLIMQGYGESFESPIKAEAGTTIQTKVPLYLVNEQRYSFYRKLHEFATDAEFKGHEKEILDGFGGFLTESDAILKSMSENTEKLELSSERLKIAQDAVKQLTAQVDELARQNEELKRKISEPVKQKKFGVPLLIGVTVGVIVGVLIN